MIKLKLSKKALFWHLGAYENRPFPTCIFPPATVGFILFFTCIDAFVVAILTTFRQKIGDFVENQWHDYFLDKIANILSHLFAENIRKIIALVLLSLLQKDLGYAISDWIVNKWWLGSRAPLNRSDEKFFFLRKQC
jgi:hypothetical protein